MLRAGTQSHSTDSVRSSCFP
uniref:Uncharacterized protein n=1 Tax=Anguilla anguilla TaxID=7936 RepID=A0A0E9QAX3_ANGAN